MEGTGTTLVSKVFSILVIVIGMLLLMGLALDIYNLHTFIVNRSIIAILLFLNILLAALLLWQSPPSSKNKVEEEIKEARAKFEALFNQTYTFLILLDTDGYIVEVNDMVMNTGGSKKEELKGIHLLDAPWASKNEEDVIKYNKAFQKVKQGEIQRYEGHVYLPNQIILTIDFSLKPVYNENHELQWLIAEGRDITGLKQTEKELEESKHFIESIASSIPQIIYVYDLTINDFVYSNRPFISLLGFTTENFHQKGYKSFEELIHPDDQERVKGIIEALEKEKVIDIEYRIKNFQNEWRWIRTRAFLFTKSKEGKVLQAIGTIEDITERKFLELKLQENQDLLKKSQEIARIGTFYIDLEKNQITGTSEHLKLHGIKEGTLLTREEVFDKIHPEDQQKVLNDIDHAIQYREELNHEFRMIRPDGKERYVWVKGRFYFDKDGKPVRHIGIITDITDRIMAEKEIQNIKEFVFLADLLPQLVWATDAEGNAKYFNKRYYEYTGLPPSEVMAWGWTKVIYPDQIEKTEKIWKESVRTGKPYEVEFCLRRHDGVYRWFLGRGAPMKDKNGNIIKWFGSCTDIQEHKERTRELIETNTQLKKINSDLDNFVYTASHDLKAPVSNLEGLVKLLKRETEGAINERGSAVINMIDKSVYKLNVTIRDLAEITQIENGSDKNDEEICFKDLLEEVKINIHSMIQASNAVFYEKFDIDCIRFNKNNFRSILYNLVSNSIKYKAPDRRPDIFVETTKENSFVVLKVKDNGIGFDVSKMDKLFAMFKRLHSQGEGSGIGLYIVKRLVENAGGKIEVNSEINKGSEFNIYLKIKK